LTDVALKDSKERIIDAVEATKSAVAEGIIAGGGVALFELCQDARPLHPAADPAMEAGISLVFDVLQEPIYKILQNAGLTPEIIIEKIKEKDETNYGYDIVQNKYGDMFEMGVIDPVRVTKQALKNAVSVASMILTTDALVSRIPEEVKKEK
jgi:chaperonin GroEL